MIINDKKISFISKAVVYTTSLQCVDILCNCVSCKGRQTVITYMLFSLILSPETVDLGNSLNTTQRVLNKISFGIVICKTDCFVILPKQFTTDCIIKIWRNISSLLACRTRTHMRSVKDDLQRVHFRSSKEKLGCVRGCWHFGASDSQHHVWAETARIYLLKHSQVHV